jgi:hypothetical protein
MAVFDPQVGTKLGHYTSFSHVDGPTCVFLNLMLKEPGTFKFLCYYLGSKVDKSKIEKLTELSHQQLLGLVEATGITNPLVAMTENTFPKLNGFSI